MPQTGAGNWKVLKDALLVLDSSWALTKRKILMNENIECGQFSQHSTGHLVISHNIICKATLPDMAVTPNLHAHMARE